LVARPVRLQMHGVELAVAPVVDVKGLLIFGRELGAVAERYAGRRAGADVNRGGQTIRIIRRPFAGAIAPAELGSAGAEANPRRPIPGSIEIPFHVSVVREQVAVAVEGRVVF